MKNSFETTFFVCAVVFAQVFFLSAPLQQWRASFRSIEMYSFTSFRFVASMYCHYTWACCIRYATFYIKKENISKQAPEPTSALFTLSLLKQLWFFIPPPQPPAQVDFSSQAAAAYSWRLSACLPACLLASQLFVATAPLVLDLIHI